jgi:hypothetical protein
MPNGSKCHCAEARICSKECTTGGEGGGRGGLKGRRSEKTEEVWCLAHIWWEEFRKKCETMWLNGYEKWKVDSEKHNSNRGHTPRPRIT